MASVPGSRVVRSWKKSQRPQALCYVVPTAPAHKVMNLDPPACIHQGSRGPLKTFPTVDYALSRRVLLGMMSMRFSSNDREVIPRQRESLLRQGPPLIVEGGLQMEPAYSYEKKKFAACWAAVLSIADLGAFSGPARWRLQQVCVKTRCHRPQSWPLRRRLWRWDPSPQKSCAELCV